MKLKDIHLKFKAFGLRRFLVGDVKRRDPEIGKKPLWMVPLSHGYHVVEDQSDDSDSVVIQREQIDGLELWLFGVFDAHVGDGVAKYLQSHLFDRNPKESQIRRKSKETMRKAYLGARAKMRQAEEAEETRTVVGSASVMVINRDKLVIANMGHYRAVVCRDGVAHQIRKRYHQPIKTRFSRRLFSARIFACNSTTSAAASTHSRGSELAVGAEGIDSDTEFIIIAGAGIWEVMKNQEAVNLIRHLEDPQEAAKCLAKEASIRMSKSNISCLVIRLE